VPIKLTENCTKIEMGIGQGFGLVDFEFKLECLDEVGQGCADLASSAIVAGQVIEGRGFELQRVAGHQLCFPQLVQAQLELLLLQVDHGGEVEILTEFF